MSKTPEINLNDDNLSDYLQTVRMCELTNDEAWIYDICDEKETLGPAYDNVREDLEYVGQGTVLSIFGKVENSIPKKKYHFWRFKIIYKIKNKNERQATR